MVLEGYTTFTEIEVEHVDAIIPIMKLIEPDWRHRLVAHYYLAKEHPGRLRVLGLLKRLLRISTVQAEVVPGVVMELDDSDYVQREILFAGGYELETLRLFDRLLKTARGVTDFGAHMGQFTLRAARSLGSSGGRVFAVEPTPAHAVALLHNAHLSGLTNIDLCTIAVSSQPAVLRMIAPHVANTGGSRLADGSDFEDLRAIPLHVAVRPAAELAGVIPEQCLDLVKIDVEGHEFHLLKSLLGAVANLPRDIIFEYKPEAFEYGPSELTLGWLRSLGYELFSVDGAPFDPSRSLVEDNLWAHLGSHG